MLELVHRRVLGLLRRRGRLPEEPSPPDPVSDQMLLSAGYASASIQELVASGPRAGHPVRRWGWTSRPPPSAPRGLRPPQPVDGRPLSAVARSSPLAGLARSPACPAGFASGRASRARPRLRLPAGGGPRCSPLSARRDRPEGARRRARGAPRPRRRRGFGSPALLLSVGRDERAGRLLHAPTFRAQTRAVKAGRRSAPGRPRAAPGSSPPRTARRRRSTSRRPSHSRNAACSTPRSNPCNSWPRCQSEVWIRRMTNNPYGSLTYPLWSSPIIDG